MEGFLNIAPVNAPNAFAAQNVDVVAQDAVDGFTTPVNNGVDPFAATPVPKCPTFHRKTSQGSQISDLDGVRKVIDFSRV
jgi:hypothetical protein